ncbi:hypothetical protein HHI36_002314, partial [Cryptolaemus montrouzieri]
MVALYRPPRGSMDVFLDKLDCPETVTQEKHYNICIAGDYNINLLKEKRKKKAINNNKYPIFDSDEVKQIRNTLDAINTIFKVTRSNGAYIAYKKCKEILRQKIEFVKKKHHLGLIQESNNKIKI